MNFRFALKTSTGGKSKDRSNPLEDLDEAERLLERVEAELEGGHPLKEGGRKSERGAEEEGTAETEPREGPSPYSDYTHGSSFKILLASPVSWKFLESWHDVLLACMVRWF